MIQSEKFFTIADPIVSNDLLRNGARNNFGPNFKDALKPLLSTFQPIQVK